MKRNTILALIILACTCLQAQESAKKGLNLGVLPAVSYNTDEGFQYGAILTFVQLRRWHTLSQVRPIVLPGTLQIHERQHRHALLF